MQLDQYERTFCDCQKCKAACRHMPGMLAPGDIDRIGDYLGIQPGAYADFVTRNFRASDGALVVKDGRPMRIPTIVPATKEDGSCVFLTSDGRCSIHPVAPFGCSRFNVCAERTPEDDARCGACLQAIITSPDYVFTWGFLQEEGCTTGPVIERRERLRAAIDAVDSPP